MTIEHVLSNLVERAVRRVLREELDRRPTKEPPVVGGYMTVKQAAEFAAVSRRTIQNWIECGDLPACRHERVLRVRRADIVALLAPEMPADVIDFDANCMRILDKAD